VLPANFSGAGKTTLLNALLSRNLNGLFLEGTVLINGKEIGEKIKWISGYIHQVSTSICSKFKVNVQNSG
jgi:ABC-type multidrug transport system ATPase subunit